MDNPRGVVAPRQTLAVEAYGRTIVIDLDDDSFSLPYLPVTWRPAASTTAADRRYTVTRTPNGRWSTVTDDEPPFTLSTADSVSEHIEGDLHHWIAANTLGYLFVHAGCVGWRNRAILIPGRSYAGKTTLTEALLRHGATYYSDDYAVIDPTGAIHPFPRRLRVRPQHPGRSERVDPAQSNWPIGHEPIRAGVVAELSYDADAGWEITHVTGGTGALSLLDNTVAARERPIDSLTLMSRAVAGAIAIRGTRDDADATAQRLIAMVDALLDGQPIPPSGP
ncbi:MAG: hypothetical protein E6R14_06035 [Thermomicrobiales bacterium]|nr:MAG: hypothetical protein E6R14_06035 [Thermomicrobiales bacterium]